MPLAALAADDAAKESAPGDELRLSDASLSGWSEVGNAGWQAENGEIWASAGGEDGMLITSRSYDNFRLTLEFKPDAEVNSGVFLRCQDAENISPLTCYEVNIWDNHPKQEFRTGSIVTRAYPPLVHLDTIGKWNRLKISALGDSLSVWVNGVETASLVDSTHRSGSIALQRWEGGEIRFRNVMIEER